MFASVAGGIRDWHQHPVASYANSTMPVFVVFEVSNTTIRTVAAMNTPPSVAVNKVRPPYYENRMLTIV